MIPLLLLLCTQAQVFELRFEPPFLSNLDVIPTQFVEHSFAAYAPSHSKTPYRHTLKVEKIIRRDGKQFVELSITRDKPQKTTLHLTLPMENKTLAHAVEATIQAPFGSFSVGEFDTHGLETTISRVREETVEFQGREVDTVVYALRYANGKEGRLWINEAYGPLGVLKARVWKGDEAHEFSLIDFGKDP